MSEDPETISKNEIMKLQKKDSYRAFYKVEWRTS